MFKQFKRAKLAAILTFLVFISGCAASGAAFTGVQKANNPSVGVVYFYRPKVYTGSAVKVQLADNGKDIERLQNGQFIRYEATPGMHEFRTDTMGIDKAVEVNIEAGNNYFIRAGVRQGLWTGTWFLTRVFESEAVSELKTCCKSGT